MSGCKSVPSPTFLPARRDSSRGRLEWSSGRRKGRRQSFNGAPLNAGTLDKKSHHRLIPRDALLQLTFRVSEGDYQTTNIREYIFDENLYYSRTTSNLKLQPTPNVMISAFYPRIDIIS